MGLFKGGALRLVQTALYLLIFCCSGIILGFYSYFLAVQADRNARIPRWQQAVEGISGAAVLYSICAILLTCCLGGVSFFAFLGLVLDLLFVGGMIAIAVLTRDGAGSCTGNVNTPLGPGNTDSNNGEFGNSGFGTGSGENVTYSVSTRTACRFNTVCFAVSIIAAFLFLATAGMQVFLARHHKKEKRYGPSPSNNYTSGPAKRKFWQRKPKTTRDAEVGMTGTAVGAGGLAVPTTHDNRASHETGYTGSTVAAPGTAYDKTDGQHGKHAPHGSHGGYYTQPQGTGVNPYGYDATTTAPHANNAATNY